MRMNTNSTEAIHLEGNTCIIEEVTEFTYLGAKFTIIETCDAEINERISKASQVFGMLKST